MIYYFFLNYKSSRESLFFVHTAWIWDFDNEKVMQIYICMHTFSEKYKNVSFLAYIRILLGVLYEKWSDIFIYKQVYLFLV